MSIYLCNKYTKWYYDIIERSRTRTITGYKEKHHIIPKSLNGSNKKHNIAFLTAREHFICHWLLTKMTIGENKAKMYMALVMMRVGHSKHKRYSSAITSRVYEKIKKQAADGFRNETNKRVNEGSHNFQNLDRKGHKHLMFDHTIYDWYHAFSKNKVSMTRYELIKTYNLKDSEVCLVIQEKKNSTQDWFLWNNKPIEYTWHHVESNTTVVMTQRNFIKTYKMNPNSVGNMIRMNRSSRGWRLQHP